MSVNIGDINERLKRAYGTNLLSQPLFRIMRTEGQVEKRFGVYAEWYGKIFIREIRGLRETPKYNYLKPRWVLERWLPPALVYDRDIPETIKGSYEPVYVFQDIHGNALEVNEDFTHRIIWDLFHPQLPGHAQSVKRTQYERAMEEEYQFNMDVLSEAGRTWIGHRLHSGEGVIVL